jgi:hypothetical protein
VFNILSCKGNANKNDTETESHPGQNGCHQENKQQILVRRGRTPLTLLVGMLTSTAMVKISMEVSQNLKLEPSYDPAVPSLGISPREYKSACNRNVRTPKFITALFTIANLPNQTRCLSTDE